MRSPIGAKNDFIEEIRNDLTYRKIQKERVLFTKTYSPLNPSNTHRGRRCHNQRPAVEFSRRGGDTFSSSVLVRGLAEFDGYRLQAWFVRDESCQLIW
jgi:hypothetical protein